MDKFEYQALRNVVKEDGNDVHEKFETKFKEMRVEGHRRGVLSAQKTSMTSFLIHTTQSLNLKRLKLYTWVLRVRLEREIKDKVLSEGRGQIQETHAMVASRDSQHMMDRDPEIEERRRS